MTKHSKKPQSLKGFFCVLILIVIIIFIVNINKGNKNSTANDSNINASIQTENTINENNYLNNNTNSLEFANSNSINVISNASEENLKTLSESERLSNGLPVFMYHFFYDSSKGETARDGNWIDVSKFESHLKYLTENNYYFPTWNEVSDYIDGKIYLPKKSVVLTVDDGDESFFKVALPVIKKYNIKITEFLVTSWNGWYSSDYPADQVSYQSHSDNMHRAGSNGKGIMTSLSLNDIVADLNQSRDVIGKNSCIVFCYPFGQFNDTAKKAVKQAGFLLAFTTEGGRVKPNMDKYELPRVRITTNTNLENFKSLLSD